jgi:hypothetical protein
MANRQKAADHRAGPLRRDVRSERRPARRRRAECRNLETAQRRKDVDRRVVVVHSDVGQTPEVVMNRFVIAIAHLVTCSASFAEVTDQQKQYSTNVTSISNFGVPTIRPGAAWD